MERHILSRHIVGRYGLLILLLAVSSLPTWAALGDNAASVLADQARMKGALSSTDNQRYVMHEIKTPIGDKVREFVTPGGAVFGVAWEGQLPPNLQQLLGPYYQQAVQAQAANVQQQSAQGAPKVRRAPVAIETPGLVLYQGGHVHSFHGVAYIPQLIPQGVQASTIR